MKISEGIKQLFNRTGAKQKDVAASLGYKSPSIISNAMARENITLDVLIRICNELNYDVVLRPSAEVRPGKRLR